MPETADVAKGSASYENGVLKLSFPKRPAPPSTRKKIPIMGSTGGNGSSPLPIKDNES